MKYTYRIRRGRCTDEEGKEHMVYGIEVLADTGDLLPEYTLPDLFCMRERTEELVKLCNDLELDPVHLFAVAEDALV